MARSNSTGLHALCAVLTFSTLLEFAMASGLSAEQKTAILDLHNQLRAQKNDNQVCTAADMQKLTWDDSLASASQTYSGACVGDHHADAGGAFGENLWMNMHTTAYTTADMRTGTQAWYDEWKDTIWSWGADAVVSKPRGQCVDGDGLHCNIGHYFQIIWAKTSKVGCGVASCSNLQASGQAWGNAVYLVCRYDVPARHFKGASVGLPYMVGKACAACPGSCKNGLCTAAPTRCVDRSSNCGQLVDAQKTQCTGTTNDYCAKTCNVCTPGTGEGYEQCDGYSADLVTTTPKPVEPCNLPAGPLNSYWECKTADGCRYVEPVDIGFFLYSIAHDPDIQCIAKCKPFSRGPLNTGVAIRYRQPSDRVAVSQKCTSPGLTLDYESMGPQSLIDSQTWLRNYCLPLEECELPALNDTNVMIDATTCTVGHITSTPAFPATPSETKDRFRKDESCHLKCKDGYELDARYGQKTGTCNFPNIQTDTGLTAGILGSVGPPLWAGGTFAIPPMCLKTVTSGWLDEAGHPGGLAKEKCNAGGNGYTIESAFKQDTGCPTDCITGLKSTKIRGYGTEGKQKITTQCRIMNGYDSSYQHAVLEYCCCAKAECFDSTGQLKPDNARLLEKVDVPQEIEEIPKDPRMLTNSCPSTTSMPMAMNFKVSGGAGSTTTSTAKPTTTVVTADIKLTVSNVTALTTDPEASKALQTGIADYHNVPAEQVTIVSITASRRLHVTEWSSRRLSGDVTVKYEINLPSTYAGAAITSSSIDAAALKTKINTATTAKGLAVQISTVEVKAVTSEERAVPTTANKGSASAASHTASPGYHAALVHMVGLAVVMHVFGAR